MEPQNPFDALYLASVAEDDQANFADNKTISQNYQSNTALVHSPNSKSTDNIQMEAKKELDRYTMENLYRNQLKDLYSNEPIKVETVESKSSSWSSTPPIKPVNTAYDWTHDFITPKHNNNFNWKKHDYVNHQQIHQPLSIVTNNPIINNADRIAYNFVKLKNELITTDHNLTISVEVQHRLAYLLGCHPHKNLPDTIYKFFLNINCVYPYQMVNKLGGNRIALAYCIAQSNPSVLFEQHYKDLWVLFAFARDYVFEHPLDQRKFKTKTWIAIKKTRDYDTSFLAIPPERFIDIREAIMETAKEDAKEYIYGVQRVIYRWINGDTSESEVGSSTSGKPSIQSQDKCDDKQDNINGNDNSTVSSFQNDFKLSRKIHNTRKSIKSTSSKSRKDTIPKQVDIQDTNINVDNNLVDNNLINFNDNVDLDDFHEAIQLSTRQFIPEWNGDRKSSGFEAPISPLDRHKFYPGCNSGIQGATNKNPIDQESYMAGVSQHSVQNRYKAPVTPLVGQQMAHRSSINDTPRVSFDPVSTQRGTVVGGNDTQIVQRTTNLLKRQALPQAVKWNGTGEDSFEDFLNSITSHIGQQAHLSYIILPEFISLWLQMGVVPKVLGLARRMNLHMSLHYITTEQFDFDITWLYNALKQAIGNGRGMDVVIRYKNTQDGIAVYHTMLNKYLYGGDLQSFQQKMEDILSTNLTRGYPGGPLEYLNNWEKASVRLKDVTPKEDWSDSALRRKFSQRFSVVGWTEHLCDSALDTTTSWQAFADSLRRKLARRNWKNQNNPRRINNTIIDHNYSDYFQTSSPMADINNVGIDQDSLSMEDHAMFQYYINTVSTKGWMVEPELWKALPDKVKSMVIEAKREARKQQTSSTLSPPSPFANKSKPFNDKAQTKLTEVDSILKSPKQKIDSNNNTSSQLPNQYSGNQIIMNTSDVATHGTSTLTASANTLSGHLNEGDPDNNPAVAMANLSSWYNDHCQPTFKANLIECKVSNQITAMLIKMNNGLNIMDAGADTHVVGNTWKPLFEITEMTPRADVIGFDTNAARKKGLPIGAYATKTNTSDGKSIILRVKHAVGNASSPHTLLCTFQIRELGIIVDDVSKNHQIDLTGNKGTQSITFKDGTKINLRCRHTLMSFKTSLPTQLEIATLPIYDIAIDEWNPQQYYDGMNDDISVKSLQDSIANDKCIINSSTIDFSMDDDISMKLSPAILEYIDYNSDTSTNLSYNSNE